MTAISIVCHQKERDERAERKTESKESSSNKEADKVFQHRPPKNWLKKAPIVFAILFWFAYLILCLTAIGVIVTAFILFISLFVFGCALSMGGKRYSFIGGYWTEPEGTIELAVFTSLLCFLFLTFLFLRGTPFLAVAFIFVVGFIATFIIAIAISK